jgi:predicted DsbA family dithiol-disulfide isomerase
MQKVKIEIWSDMVCPFCYLGKKKIEKAISKFDAHNQVEIVWRSYMLDPDFPKDTAILSTQILVQKKGISESQLKGMYQHLESNGKNYGINFNFDKALSFNTLDAHRIWHWSKKFQKQNEWKEAIMNAYFTDGKDLSSKENLIELASSIDLDREGVAEILNSEAYAEDVEKDIYQSRTLHIQGVPYFLINEKAIISGAQDDKVFENVIKTALGR